MSISGWQSLALQQFTRARAEFCEALEGLDDRLVNARFPGIQNSLGWTAWHLSRGVDRNVSEIHGRFQLWIIDGWASRFGRPADPADTGFGHTEQEAAGVQIVSVETLVAYHVAVYDLVQMYLRSAPNADADRLVKSPTFGNIRTVEDRLVGLLWDTFAHLGQMTILRQLARKMEPPHHSRDGLRLS